MRREKNRGHRGIVLLLLLVILALSAIACLLALRLYQRNDPSLTGTWQMRADLTETARARANAWLRQAALGDTVDAADYLPRLYVSVRLTLSEDGTWSRELSEADYESARAEAEQGLAAALRELLRLRTVDAGRLSEAEQETETRIARVIGMSTEQYISDYGPALLPTLSALHAYYDGGGTWRAEGQLLRFEEGTVRYLADDRLLVLMRDEGTEVYERAK